VKIEDIDIMITSKVRLYPKTIPSISERLEINQEELRLNYYMDKISKFIEQQLRSGKKFKIQDFLETSSR